MFAVFHVGNHFRALESLVANLFAKFLPSADHSQFAANLETSSMIATLLNVPLNGDTELY